VRRAAGRAVHVQADDRAADLAAGWLDRARRPERDGPGSGAGQLRRRSLVVALRLAGAGAAPSRPGPALPPAVAAHEADEPGAASELGRRRRDRVPPSDRAAWLVGDGGSQLGLGARRALD